jgi:hypothetical protein
LQQVDHVDYFITQLCIRLCLVREEARQPMNEAEFGEIFSHIDCLVTYMQEHASIADAALRPRPSPLPRSEQDALDITPVYTPFLQRYPLLCLTFAWQSQRLANFPDPARDNPRQQLQQQDEQQPQEGSGDAVVNFTGDAVKLPPFGWVDALDRLNVNWFGYGLAESNSWEQTLDEEECSKRYFSLQLWREAGLGLWDEKRVEAIKRSVDLAPFRQGGLYSSGVTGFNSLSPCLEARRMVSR